MAGFSGELLFFVGLGYVLLGPKRMHDVLQRLARAKHDFDKTRAELTAQLSTNMTAEEKDPQA